MPTLERLGRENLDAIEDAVARYGIDCDFERTGEIVVATAPWQVDELRELPDLAAQFGGKLEWLDADQVRAKVDVADLPRRGARPGRCRDGRPGPARLRAAGRLPAASGCGSTRTPPCRGSSPTAPAWRSGRRTGG